MNHLELKKFKEQNYLENFNWEVTNVSIKSREIQDDSYFNIWTSKIINRSVNVLDIEIEIKRYFKHYYRKIAAWRKKLYSSNEATFGCNNYFKRPVAKKRS